MTNAINIKITGHIRTAIDCGDYLTLDGALFAVAMRERYGPEQVKLPGAMLEKKSDVELPFERREINGKWFYACSIAQWDPVEWIDRWTKRIETKYIGMTDFRKKLNTGGGRYRGYYMPIFAHDDNEVFFYAVTTDIERLRFLLRFVTHLGKKPAQGWGRIWKWDIEEIKENWSIWKDGKLMRPLPVDDGNSGILYSIRPPGWRRDTQVECMLP